MPAPTVHSRHFLLSSPANVTRWAPVAGGKWSRGGPNVAKVPIWQFGSRPPFDSFTHEAPACAGPVKAPQGEPGQEVVDLSAIPTERIRNVAVVGQTGSGKTSLVEAIHHYVNKTARMGRIEDGNTVSDFEPEEVKHRHSISLSMVSLEHRGHKINLLDTPGVLDFAGEVHAALHACDLALFVVPASEPINHDTLRIWQLASKLGKPRMCFINKLDKERADFDATIERLAELFGQGLAPVEMPLGQAEALRGVIDLFSETATIYSGGAASEEDLPDDVAVGEHRAHDLLIEGIVVADEDLMAAYLDGEVPEKASLEAIMAQGVHDSVVYPVVVGSAVREVGIDRLLDFICEIAPPPEGEPESAVVRTLTFKTIADPFLGRVNLMKVLSGKLTTDAELTNARTKTGERLHSLFSLSGKEHNAQSEVSCGDLIAVAKLASVRTGDVLSSNKAEPEPDGLGFEVPMLRVQVIPAAKGQEEKLALALSKLNEEEPTLRVGRDNRSHNLILAGLGELQITTALEKVERRYQLSATLAPCEVEYLETLAGASQVEGKYKKQTGGHGQFGVARVRFAPLARGSGVQFLDEIVGGAIPRQFIPAVEKGLFEAAEHGGMHGYPVVDFEAHLYDGAFHSVDSSEMSFKMAGSLALREAIAKTSTVVLEPVMEVAVTVPTRLQGDVLGDLSSRRAKVTGTEIDDKAGTVTVVALVPANEIASYASELRSITAGQGSYEATYDHHEPLPKALYNRLAQVEEKEK